MCAGYTQMWLILFATTVSALYVPLNCNVPQAVGRCAPTCDLNSTRPDSCGVCVPLNGYTELPQREILFYSLNDFYYGTELYAYDGVSLYRVTDIASNTADSNPSDFVVFRGKLYFSAEGNALYGRELYKTDANPTPLSFGFSLAYDVFPGPISSDPRELIVIGKYNDTLVFSANTSLYGREIVIYDGYTVSYVDINFGIESSNPYELTRILPLDPATGKANDVTYKSLICGATRPATGTEPVRIAYSTSSFGYTFTVIDALGGLRSSYPANFSTSGNKVIMSAVINSEGRNRELYGIDLTTNVFGLVANLNYYNSSNPGKAILSISPIRASSPYIPGYSAPSSNFILSADLSVLYNNVVNK